MNGNNLLVPEPTTLGATPTAVGVDREEVVRLERAGTVVLVRVGPGRLPSIVHWGEPVGETASAALLGALDVPETDSVTTTQAAVGIVPLHSSGWLGRPGLLGHRDGRDWSISLDTVEHLMSGTSGDEAGEAGTLSVVSRGVDGVGGLVLSTEIELDACGLLRTRARVENTGAAPYEVTHLEPGLPVPASATELLDQTGRHSAERHPQRHSFDIGAWVRESWGGRSGHDSPTLLCAGERSFGFRSGDVWAAHVAASGNQVLYAERTVTDWRLLRGGERLLPGEVILQPGESYDSPWLVGSWGHGLDELSGRIHASLRHRPHHPGRPRPVLLNTWEAAYFDHDVEHLIALAEQAAALGVERYVLDDGWFGRRRDDTKGLGDWTVSPQVWPQGLHPLVDRVHELGMEFGLWFEPEMVNLDSALAEEHPEWIFQTPHGPGISSRYQHVLDLGHADAYQHVLGQVSALVSEYDIAYLKWDHNRPVVDGGHWPTGRPGVHAHARAVLRMMAELKQLHPGLEIESCAGGGARIDLATTEVTDRVWVSDTIDAHERHRLNVATGLLLPPELLGTHVGSGADHSTGRNLALNFRAGTAIWGHMGIEWDLTSASPADLERLGEWVSLHKRFRELLHTGVVVHSDVTNPALQLDGVVDPAGGEALYKVSMLDHSLIWPPGRVTLPGLDADREYTVELVGPTELANPAALPAWASTRPSLSGAALGTVGLQCPYLSVDELVVIHALATP